MKNESSVINNQNQQIASQEAKENPMKTSVKSTLRGLAALFAVGVSLSPIFAFGTVNPTATVTQVGSGLGPAGSNSTFLYFITNGNGAPGCQSGNTVFIDTSVPTANIAYVTAMTAKLKNLPIYINYHVDGAGICWLDQIGVE